MINHSYAFEIGFLETLYQKDKQDTLIIEMLASYYTKVGRIDEGLRMDRRHVRLDPASATAHYNLACSLSLKDRKPEAVRSLKTALELGFEDYEWLMKDPDLRPLQGYKRFEELLDSFAIV